MSDPLDDMDKNLPDGYLRARIQRDRNGWFWSVESYVNGMRVLPPWVSKHHGYTKTKRRARRESKAVMRRLIRERKARSRPPIPPTFIYQEEV